MLRCANCDQSLDDHCQVHLIPCCPGKCEIEQMVHNDQAIAAFALPFVFVPGPGYDHNPFRLLKLLGGLARRRGHV
jgi:hypothetical protein